MSEQPALATPLLWAVSELPGHRRDVEARKPTALLPLEMALVGDVTPVANILPGHPHFIDVQTEALKRSDFLSSYS